jgi:hypothetical protein
MPSSAWRAGGRDLGRSTLAWDVRVATWGEVG